MGGLSGVAQRDLSEYEITHPFVDGIAERLRPSANVNRFCGLGGSLKRGRGVRSVPE